MTKKRWQWLPLLYVSVASSVLIFLLAGAENGAFPTGAAGAALVYAPQQGFAVLPALLALLSGWKRNFKALALNAVALVVWAHWLLGWNVPFGALHPFSPAPATFRVMTYNVQRGERGVPGLMATITAQQPDILCVQESQDAPPKFFPYPGNDLKRSLKTWHSAEGGDVLTLSRFPLVSQRLWPLDGGRRILETVWQTPRGPVRVLNIHITKSDAERQLQNRDFASFASQLGANARLASQTRLAQIPALYAALAARPELPLVVAGDFNSPPRGSFYRALTDRLTDTWREAGWGYPATFPSRWPVVGIDHIFGRGVRATRALVPDSRASDHRPLVADISLNGS